MNTLAILSALLSIVSYSFYSKHYENTVRQVNSPLESVALLYGLSSLILIGMTLLSAVVFGFKTTLSDPSVWAASSGGILKLIGLMSLLYYGHIVSEAICRKKMNMGFYAIFFQANIVVIVALNWWFHNTPVSVWSFMGGFLVLVSSVAVLFFSQKSNKTAFVAHDKKTGWATSPFLTSPFFTSISRSCAM